MYIKYSGLPQTTSSAKNTVIERSNRVIRAAEQLILRPLYEVSASIELTIYYRGRRDYEKIINYSELGGEHTPYRKVNGEELLNRSSNKRGRDAAFTYTIHGKTSIHRMAQQRREGHNNELQFAGLSSYGERRNYYKNRVLKGVSNQSSIQQYFSNNFEIKLSPSMQTESPSKDQPYSSSNSINEGKIYTYISERNYYSLREQESTPYKIVRMPKEPIRDKTTPNYYAILPKHPASMFCIAHKWLRKTLVLSFSQINMIAVFQRKQEVRVNILLSAAQRIYKAKITNLLALAFAFTKRCYLSLVNSRNQSPPFPYANRQERCAFGLLYTLFRNHLRSAFYSLKKLCDFPYEIQKGIAVFGNMILRKKRYHFRRLHILTKRNYKQQQISLNRFKRIWYQHSISYKHKTLKLLALNIFSQAKPTNDPPKRDSTRNQALIDDSPGQTLDKEIAALTKSIFDKKRYFYNYKHRTAQIISELRAYMNQIKPEVYEKKERNADLKQKLYQLPAEEQIFVLNNEDNEESVLSRLTEIYAFLLSTTEYTINTQYFINHYGLEKNYIQEYWRLIEYNAVLKREINNYEKVPVVSSRAQQMQCEEQGAVVQILRNYVKERYLWYWMLLIGSSI